MARTSPPTDVIEVFEPPDHAFATEDPTPPASRAVARAFDSAADGDRRSAWVVPVFAAVLIAAAGTIVLGTVTDRSQRAASTTTTAAIEPATAPSTLRIVVVRPPETYALVFAGDVAPAALPDPSNSFELWAAPGATADRGAWFSVTRTRQGAEVPPMLGAYRTTVGVHEVLLAPPTQQRPTTIIQAVVDDQLIQVESHAWFARPLERLVDVILGGGDGTTTDHVPVYRGGNESLLDLTVDTRQTMVFVDGSQGFGRSITFTVGTASPWRDAVLPFALHEARQVKVPGGVATVGYDLIGANGVAGRVTATDEAVVQWVSGNQILTLAGDVPLDDLVAIANTAQATSDEAYADLVDSIGMHAADEAAGSFQSSRLAGDTVFVGDAQYRVEITVDLFSAVDEQRVGYRLTTSWPTRPSTRYSPTAEMPSDEPMISSIADNALTAVVASTPVGSAAVALQVNVTGQPPALIPLRRLPAPTQLLVAEYVFTEAMPFTAQLLDATGAAVAAWPQTRTN